MDKMSGKNPEKNPEINTKKNTNAGRFLYNLGQNPFDQSNEQHIQKGTESTQPLHPDLVSKSDTSNKKDPPEWGYFGASMGLCSDFSPNMIRVMQELTKQTSNNKDGEAESHNKDGEAESQSQSSQKKQLDED